MVFRLVSDLTSHGQLKMFHHGQSQYAGWSVHMGKISSLVTEIYEHLEIFVRKRVARQDLGNQASRVDWAHIMRP